LFLCFVVCDRLVCYFIRVAVLSRGLPSRLGLGGSCLLGSDGAVDVVVSIQRQQLATFIAWYKGFSRQAMVRFLGYVRLVLFL